MNKDNEKESSVSYCGICKRQRKNIFFKNVGNHVCHECQMKLLEEKIKSGKTSKKRAEIRNEIRRSQEYKWVFELLNTRLHYNACVSVMMFEELCVIDKRFERLPKTFLKGTGVNDRDCYILTNPNRFDWLVVKEKPKVEWWF